MDKYELTRRSYRPDHVKLLLIGESRPASGTFFYNCNSNLFWATEFAFNSFFKKSLHNTEFLKFFMNLGCYLEDLCEMPVNRLPIDLRIDERIKSMPKLQKKLIQYKPEIVVIVMKDIADCITTVLKDSKIDSVKIKEMTAFPIGSEKNKSEFHSSLIKVLQKAVCDKVIIQ